MLLKCQECQKEISHTAGKCPDCGCKIPFAGIHIRNKDIKQWKNADRVAFTKSGGEIKFNFGLLKGLFSTLFILFVGFVVNGVIKDSQLTPEEKAERENHRSARRAQEEKRDAEKAALEDEERCSDKTMAFVMSQNFVKKELKSPSTAKFPYTSSKDVRIEYVGDCTHDVWAYVDAQNTFGASMRTKYHIKIKNTKGTESWTLLDIKM